MSSILLGSLVLPDGGEGDSDVRHDVKERLEEAGLTVHDGVITSFAEAPRYSLSATIDRATHEEHARYREVQLMVEWEVTDQRTGRVVYETGTTGYVARPPGLSTRSELGIGVVWITSYVPPQDVWAALDDAVDRLAARPGFRQVVSGNATLARDEEGTTPDLQVRRCAVTRSLPGELEDALDSALTVVDGEGDLVGSAVVVSEDGWALTAAHVVAGIRGVPGVKLRGGPRFLAEVVRVDEASDVALLKVEGAGFSCSPLASERPRVGTEVWAVGTPLDASLELSVARGIVSGLRSIAGWELLQTDASVTPGYSGGPMLLADGTVGGVTSFKLRGTGIEGIAFGVPSTIARKSLRFVESDISDPVPTGDPTRHLSALVSDPDDPSRYGELDDVQRTRMRKGAWVAIGIGSVTTGIGAALSGGALAGWVSNDSKTKGQFNGLRWTDALGATLIVTGGTTLAFGGANLGTP